MASSRSKNRAELRYHLAIEDGFYVIRCQAPNCDWRDDETEKLKALSRMVAHHDSVHAPKEIA